MLRPVRWGFYATLALFLGIAISCASQQTALRVSLTSLNAARDGFIAWDDAHQGVLVTQAKTLEEGKASLASYIGKRETVIRAFDLAYKAIATAALDPSTANLGVFAADLADLVADAKALGAAWPPSTATPTTPPSTGGTP